MPYFFMWSLLSYDFRMLRCVQKIPKVHVRLEKRLLVEYNLSIETIVSTHFPHLTYVLIN
jgi:hypothetical protein